MKESLALVLSCVAACIHVIAFCLYGRGIIKNRVKPSTATWTIWALGSFITLFSYNFVARDFLKESVALVDSIGCLAIFFISWSKGKLSFKDMGDMDLLFLAADILAIIIWIVSGSVLLVYVVLQVSAAISIVPTCREVWRDSEAEHPLVWFLWASAYAVSGIVVMLRWQGFEMIIYQVNYTLMHLAIGILCVVKQSRLKVQVAIVR